MKTSLNGWLDQYSVTHKNPKNKLIHKVCVPLIMFSIFGILRVIPFPLPGGWNWPVGWDWILLACALVFYFSLGIRVGVMMAIVGIVTIALTTFLQAHLPLLWLSIAIFVIGWIGQFIGHGIEGKKPSFIDDMRFLLIGPLWVFRGLFAK